MKKFWETPDNLDNEPKVADAQTETEVRDKKLPDRDYHETALYYFMRNMYPV